MMKASRVKQAEWEFSLHSGSSNVGVVLVHEIFGFNDYIDSVADQFSREGIWAAAVNMFRGKRATSLKQGFKLRSALKDKEIADALQSGLRLLRGRNSQSALIGSMGFCMGGGFALLGACNSDFAFCVD